MVIINIKKKDLFLLSAIMVFLIAVGYVVAYNYLNSIPNPGHGGDNVFISINGVSKNLQQAINDGNFDTAFTGGSFSGPITQGHKGEEIVVNIGGNIKSFQEAINDSSLCWVEPGTSPSNFAGTYGNNGDEIWIDIKGSEKTLQQAINDGDFSACIPSYLLADVTSIFPDVLRRAGDLNNLLVTIRFITIPMNEFNQTANFTLTVINGSGSSFEMKSYVTLWSDTAAGYASSAMAGFNRVEFKNLLIANNFWYGAYNVNITGKMISENQYFYGEDTITITQFAGD